jgi:hypothetical protein
MWTIEASSMSKFTYAERETIKSIVASLTIKRIPDNEILKVIFDQVNKTMTIRHLSRIKQQIKRESYLWYSQLREGDYEFIHEFKQRINEIIWLQKKHQEIIDSPTEPTSNKQSSLAELHRLNITLSNYFDVAPTIIGNVTIPTTPETKSTEQRRKFIV